MFNLVSPQPHDLRIIATTPTATSNDSAIRSEEVALWFGGTFVPRKQRSIDRLFLDYGAEVVVIADVQPMVYHRDNPAEPLFFHPGMAQHRISQTKLGQRDRLLRVAGIQFGDVVIDATLGLGSDSLVLAAGVGEQGRVVGLESSFVLARLFAYACHHETHKYKSIQPYLSHIEVHHARHLEFLTQSKSNSADVVFFDPMFRHPTAKPSSIDPGRIWTNSDRLSMLAFEEAKRVAKRAVVVKERPYSDEFRRFGLVPDKMRSPFAYGVWRKEDAYSG